MDKKAVREKIEFLTKEINTHNKNYYVDNSPTISDYEFDLLLQELIELEALYPDMILPDSPTQKVGSDLSNSNKLSFKQYPHKYPMLSLSNTYNINELKEFDERVKKLSAQPFSYNCELKFDGTGINLLYRNGVLVRALTRGDGNIGDDVLRNIKTIQSIPIQLNANYSFPSEFEIRGEVYMPYEAFDKLNAETFF